MPKNPNYAKTTASLYKLLESKALSNRADDGGSAPLKPTEFFEAFRINGIDVNGQLSSAIAQRGAGIGIRISFNAGALILPSILTLEAGFSATASSSKARLIMLQRQQEQLYYSNNQGYINEKPIALITLNGTVRELDLKVDLTLAISLPQFITQAVSELGPEELGLALSASASITASGGYKGTYMSLVGDNVSWYSALHKEGLAVAFNQSLGPGGLGDIMGDAANWLLNNSGLNIREKKGLPSGVVRLEKHHITDKVRTSEWKYDNLQSCLKSVQTYYRQNSTYAPAHYQETIDSYLNRLQSAKAPPTVTEDYRSNLNTLTLWAHKGEIGLGVKANVALTATGAGAQGEAGGGITGILKHTSYRLQTVSAPLFKNPVIATQDTVIDYRQVNLNYNAQTKANAATFKHEFNTAGEIPVYNMMTYRSAIAYWTYQPNLNQVACRYGSGVSFGISVTSQRLVQLVEHLISGGSLNNKQTNLVNTIAAQLQVHPQDITEFLKTADILNGFNYKLQANALLVESNFQFITPSREIIPLTSVKIKAKSESNASVLSPFLKTWINNKFMTGSRENIQLQSLRIRYRAADSTLKNADSNGPAITEKQFFKLGINFVKKLGIQLRKIDEAGNEGILDLHTAWLGGWGSQLTEDGRNEMAVPPVALIHQ